MATETLVNVPGDERNITEPAAIELNEVIDEAVAAGFNEDMVLAALEKVLQSRRDAAGLPCVAGPTSIKKAEPRSLLEILNEAQRAALDEGNERITYLLGLALDEAKTLRA